MTYESENRQADLAEMLHTHSILILEIKESYEDLMTNEELDKLEESHNLLWDVYWNHIRYVKKEDEGRD